MEGEKCVYSSADGEWCNQWQEPCPYVDDPSKCVEGYETEREGAR
jgi:hypothetical protein